MAFLTVKVSGNPAFGGYLSMDKTPSSLIADDLTFEIENGLHLFEVHSRSDGQRKAGNAQSVINSWASIGAIGDAISDAQAENAIGDTWSFQASLEENDVIILEILSKGNNIIAAPQYRVEELDEETAENWREVFRKQREEEEREREEKARKREEERSKPRRSKPKIIVGAILGGLGALYTLLMLALSEGEMDGVMAPVIVFAAMFVVGLILFLTGIKKKIRK